MITPTSLTLLEKVCSQSDPEAYALFDRLYRPLIFGLCKHMKLQDADADDVTQKVLMEVRDRLGTFVRQRPGSFRRFLTKAVRWRVLDFLRRAPENEEPLDSGFEIPTRDVVAEEITAPKVRLGVLELLRQEGSITENDVDVVCLRLVAEIPAKQVGELKGMSEGAVNTATCRVKKKLRDRFPELLED
jgi:RNA polymerase sigma-70 factor (ECF subfamily)